MNPLAPVLNVQAAVASAAPQLTKLKQACQDMESTFVKSLVSQMRKSAGDVHFGEELGGDIYRDMMDDTLSNTMAQKQTLGISRVLYKPMATMILNQELGAQRAASAAPKTNPTTEKN